MLEDTRKTLAREMRWLTVVFLAVTVILVSIAFFVMDRSSYFWWNTGIEIAFYAPCFVFVPISLLYLVYETVMTIKHGFYLSGFVSCANSALAWFFVNTASVYVFFVLDVAGGAV